MLAIVLIGLFLGSIVFAFTFILSKRTGKYYLAPIITFFASVGITAYGLFFIGGFEGMAYGIMAFGFLLTSIIGTLLLPRLTRNKSPEQLTRGHQVSLFILPLLLFFTIGAIIYSDKGYWIIDQGTTGGEVEGYQTDTIMEGSKEVYLLLGEAYLGKEIEVKKVSRRGPTTITVEIVEGGNEEKAPFIRIGVDEIKEPLTVQTTDGVVFEPVN